MLYSILRKRKDRLKRNLEKLTGGTWKILEDSSCIVFRWSEKKCNIIFHTYGFLGNVDMIFFNVEPTEYEEKIRDLARSWYVGCYQEKEDADKFFLD
jgi:hypothetical protein